MEAALGYYMSFGEDATSEAKVQFYNILPQAPVLYMVGTMDGVALEEITKQMEQNMPHGSKVMTFTDAGHFLHHEVFPQFISEVKQFLEVE